MVFGHDGGKRGRTARGIAWGTVWAQFLGGNYAYVKKHPCLIICTGNAGNAMNAYHLDAFEHLSCTIRVLIYQVPGTRVPVPGSRMRVPPVVVAEF